MDIKGKVTRILPETNGESARGPWVRGGFVIETDETYPRQVAFRAFGEDRMQSVRSLVIGSDVVVTFAPESREFNERWYTDLNLIRVQAMGAAPGQQYTGQPAQAPATPAPAAQGMPANTPSFASEPEQDLPF